MVSRTHPMTRVLKIESGTITLPEVLLEQSGIGTTDGTVTVVLQVNGEIVVRAAPERQGVPVSPALAAIRAHARNLPLEVQAMQDDEWDTSIAQGIADHYRDSEKDADGGT